MWCERRITSPVPHVAVSLPRCRAHAMSARAGQPATVPRLAAGPLTMVGAPSWSSLFRSPQIWRDRQTVRRGRRSRREYVSDVGGVARAGTFERLENATGVTA
jgi:hypothetical protein